MSEVAIMHRIENTTDNLKLLLSDDHGEQYYNAFTSILNGAFVFSLFMLS